MLGIYQAQTFAVNGERLHAWAFETVLARSGNDAGISPRDKCDISIEIRATP